MPENDKNPVSVPGEETELSEEELDNVSGGTLINTNTAPSTSIGADKSIQVQPATFRQTIDESLANKIIQSLGKA